MNTYTLQVQNNGVRKTVGSNLNNLQLQTMMNQYEHLCDRMFYYRE